jgi:DNA-binding SARP family transcriptional activator
MTAAPQPGREHDTDEAPHPRYLVNVLGHFDVWHGERDLTPPAGHCAAVVQLLALHNGVMHRDRLVAELWPDDPPWVGLQRLRNVLSRLRRHTGPLVGRDRRRNLVRYTQPVRVDLTEFLTLSGQAITLARSDPDAAIEQGTRALMLYRGPLLLDQPFAEWAHPPRTHAAERHRLLMDALTGASEELGQPDQANLYRHAAYRAPGGA